jgi:Aerotolerance regulator N-terminal
MAWQNPEAFWALALVAVPIAIHFLRKHRSARVPFPSLRFVQRSHAAAVRMRNLSDWLLLAVRVATLGLAISALAGPIVLAPSRLDAWDRRMARAVVVDTSESMRMAGEGGEPAAQAADEAADKELGGATFTRHFQATDLGDGMARAIAWLKTTPPSRREVVVISDFHRGAFDDGAAARVRPDVGLRLVAVGRPGEKRRIAGAELLGVDDESSRAETIELTADATVVTLHASAHPAARGLRFVLPPNSADAAGAILRTIARAGAPAGSAEEPIVFRFADAPPVSVTAIASPWMVRTVFGMIDDPALQAESDASQSRSLDRTDPWIVLANDRDRKPMLRAAAAGGELIFDVAARPETLFAASVVRAALVAHAAARRDEDEQEIAPIDRQRLLAWNRPSPPLGNVSPDVLRRVESSDARWLWAVVVILLACEQWLRARTTRTDVEAQRVAA